MLSLQKACNFLCLVFFSLNVEANLSSSSSSCSHDEASALIQFKSSFTIDRLPYAECDSAAFKSYPKTDSWKQGTDCCSVSGMANGLPYLPGLDTPIIHSNIKVCNVSLD
ncbi:hypothetical protein PTKIN_Ptkin14bG0028400 [Pterospermum kingtungense]